MQGGWALIVLLRLAVYIEGVGLEYIVQLV